MKTLPRPAKPSPHDFLDIGSLLGADERLVRDTVRAFVAEEIQPHIASWFDEGRFPRELIPKIAELGLFGMHLEGYGCAGASAVAYGLACMELEAADSGVRSFISVQGSLAMYAIWAFGSEEQKQAWLPKMARGEAIGCFGLTEWDFGSDPAGMRTTAKRSGSDFVLNGGKAWITNGGIADLAIVWARTEAEDGQRAGAIRGFIVPKGVKGFRTQNIERKISLRASVTSELILEDVRLPHDAILPNVSGLKGPLSCLSEARCYETALEYAKTRIQFDKPIGSFQLTQAKLVDMLLELQKGQLLALHLGRMKDEGKLQPEHVSFGKLNNVREALKICREARTILGASGITLEYPIIRHMNNLESVLTYEGTSEIHTLILGEALTGIAAYK